MALSGHPRKTLFSYWADMELDWRELQIGLGCKLVPRKPPYQIHKYKKRLVIITADLDKPVGVSDWLASKPESYGYEDEPND